MKNGKGEVVLLDHGLYDSLSESNRVSLCRIYKAIILRDEDGMARYAAQLGVEDWYPFCILLVQRPIYTRSHPRRPMKRITRKTWKNMSKEDQEKLKEKMQDMHDKFLRAMKDMPRGMLLIFSEILVQRPLARDTLHLPSQLTEKDFEYMTKKAKHHFDEIMAVLRTMPQAMLLIIRNLNTIRSINRLHGHPCDRYTIMAQCAISGANIGVELKHTFKAKLASFWERVVFDYKLKSDRWLIWLGMLYMKVLHLLGRIPNLSELNRVMEEQEERMEKI
ncbi:putative aarF domain-containing protein kinase 5 [Lamellibrachia satsuma]|nr:putative aarF domain-containing protein kinase 5 [Lamellibrachia satsuma]